MTDKTVYRLPAATTVGRVRLQVSDLERSLGFYRDVLGFTRVGGEDPVALLGGADGAVLVELHAREGARPVPRGGRLGLYHFAVLLPDRSALGRFLAHVGRLRQPAGMSDHLVSEAIYLQDPDGLGIEVYADRPRESWRYRAGELEMATAPLDVDGLLQAADPGRGRAAGADGADGAAGWGRPGGAGGANAAEPWRMPAGTRIGHLHLHVGDLAAAAAFYHAALGLDEVVWSYPGALFLSAGGYHHHLGVNTWAAGAPPAGEGDARLLEWELVLPAAGDVEAVGDHLGARGFAVAREGGSARVSDPWGTRLRLRASADDIA